MLFLFGLSCVHTYNCQVTNWKRTYRYDGVGWVDRGERWCVWEIPKFDIKFYVARDQLKNPLFSMHSRHCCYSARQRPEGHPGRCAYGARAPGGRPGSHLAAFRYGSGAIRRCGEIVHSVSGIGGFWFNEMGEECVWEGGPYVNLHKLYLIALIFFK